MKRLLLHIVLLAPLRLLAAPDAIATPDILSYQGKIATAGGALIGGGGTPENKDLTFRIWTSPTETTAAYRLWSEKITTTVSEGEFSVMLGSGDTVQGETNQRASFAEVFAGQNSVTTTPSSSKRYLGITIGTGTDEIFPRQEIVTTAFAFRAKVAESVAAGGIADGLIGTAQLAGGPTVNAQGQTVQVGGAVTVEKLANDAVTSAKILDGQVMAVDLASDAVTEAKIAALQVTTTKLANNAVTTAKIADGQVTAAKLASDVSGFWSVAAASGGNPPPSVYRATGKVGIGVTAPSTGSDLPTAAALLQIRDRPADLASFNTTPTAWIGTATNNGGATLAAPETALVLARPGVTGTYPNLARFDLSRYENAPNGSRTQLDIRLSQNDLSTEGNNTPTVMSLRGDGSVAVAGKITSPMFKVTEVIPYNNPFTNLVGDPNTTQTYIAGGGTWVVTATMTCYVASSQAVMTARLKIDGVEAGIIKSYSSNTRQTLTRQFIVRGKPAGTYNINWSLSSGGMDSSDYWQLTIMELPL